MIYTVPTSKAKDFLKDKQYIVATDEGEAVSLAVGEYLATGIMPTVVMGENGFLNALDAIITLVQMYEIPIYLMVFPRTDEKQHALVTRGLKKLLKIYNINATLL